MTRYTNARQTVLVVDDTPDNILTLTRILKEYHHVRAAPSGKKAIEIVLSADPPDLILLDTGMPEMDGHEVCQSIRDIRNIRDIPIIFLTSVAEPEAVSRGFELGAADYIAKPFNPPELLARVKTHLALKKSRGDLQRVLSQAKRLSGLLPICAGCKKIRDDKGHWQKIEWYIRQHTEAKFTHSICPECYERLYPDFRTPYEADPETESCTGSP